MTRNYIIVSEDQTSFTVFNDGVRVSHPANSENSFLPWSEWDEVVKFVNEVVNNDLL
jgi:hypothetical protein